MVLHIDLLELEPRPPDVFPAAFLVVILFLSDAFGGYSFSIFVSGLIFSLLRLVSGKQKGFRPD